MTPLDWLIIGAYFLIIVAIARRGIREGQHRNPTDKLNYFTTAFFHRPEELRAEVLTAGFQVDELLAVEGAAVFLQDLDEQWADPLLRGRLLEAQRWLETDPAVMGATGHIMAVASKLT